MSAAILKAGNTITHNNYNYNAHNKKQTGNKNISHVQIKGGSNNISNTTTHTTIIAGAATPPPTKKHIRQGKESVVGIGSATPPSTSTTTTATTTTTIKQHKQHKQQSQSQSQSSSPIVYKSKVNTVKSMSRSPSKKESFDNQNLSPGYIY